MSSFAESAKNSFLALGIGTFLFMSLFGMFHSAMSMSMDGKMSDCPFMPGMNVCPMSPIEHVSFMQSFFTNIPQEENPLLALLFSLAFVAIVGLVWSKKLFSPPDPNLKALQYFYRQRSYSILRLLQELFSQGILNPKPF
jgi:hypothetical protein